MIDVRYVTVMASYGAWQNDNLAAAADSLTDEARRLGRGAVFGSIFGTLNHLLWGDRIWMHRFAGTEKPAQGSIPDSVAETADWRAYREARAAMDRAIADWADALDPAWIEGDLTWWSGAVQREVQRPKSMLILHFFNHGTHHRGQVHAMLTAAGAKPGDTDLFLMPD